MNDSSAAIMQKSITIGLAWQTMSSTNLGVSALAWSQLELIARAARAADVAVDLIQFCHSESSSRQALAKGVALGDRLSIRGMLAGRSRIVHQLRNCAVVLDIGEGDSFSDIYGPRRFAWLALFKAVAIFAGTRLVLSPQTIGPFERGWVRTAAAILIRKAHKTFARDHLSRTYVEQLGHSAEEVTDVAFALPFDVTKQLRKGVLHVGVNVSGLLYHGGYTGANQFNLIADYRNVIHQLLTRLCERSDVVVHLIAHVIATGDGVDDDSKVCEALHSQFPATVLAPKFESPSAAKSYISGLDYFTGGRMHACIAAFSSGVPVVPMAYSRKFNGLFESLGYQRLADLKAENTEQIVEKVLSGLEERGQIAAEVARGNTIASQRLDRYVGYLASIFKESSTRNP